MGQDRRPASSAEPHIWVATEARAYASMAQGECHGNASVRAGFAPEIAGTPQRIIAPDEQSHPTLRLIACGRIAAVPSTISTHTPFRPGHHAGAHTRVGKFLQDGELKSPRSADKSRPRTPFGSLRREISARRSV